MPTPIPLSVLFGEPERVLPSISPDGRHLAWLAPAAGGALNIHVDGTPVTHESRGVRQYWWSHDGRHLLWLRDGDGDENFHLVAVDVATGEIADLTPFENTRCQVVAIGRSSNDALVGLNRRDRRVFDLYRVSIDARACELVAENDDVDQWLVAPGLELVGATRMRDDGRVELLRFADGAWSVVNRDVGDYLAVLAYGVTATGDVLLRTDKNRPTRVLAKANLATGELTTVFADPDFDIQSVVVDPHTREPQAVVVERDRPETVVLDASVADDWAQLKGLHYGRPVIVSRNAADSVWIVGYLSDRGPVAHYRWDRTAQAATFLFDHRPEMHDYEWAPMEPFEFTAHDGLIIRGYVTFPPGARRHMLPAVVNVHGGPWRRNVWSFDPEAQWLANRGYVSIQVNYRGSAGYGQAFLDAGDQEWGAKMLDDLVDAVDHLADRQLIDVERVAIMGVSYGGYATLAGLTFTNTFACGISRVGPANLITFINSLPTYWEPTIELWHRRVGHPERDRHLLESRSPLFHVDQIDRPLLLVHGARDPRVPIAEAEALVVALKQHGIPHEYLVFENEGHGINQPINRDTFYRRAEGFLAQHL